MEVLRGKIGREEGLREALEIITGFKSVNGVLEIHGTDIGGRIGIAWGRFITGALLDSGTTGKNALRRLLRLREGSFSFLDTEGEPVMELRQSLGVDLNGVVPYVPEDIRQSVTSWLFDPGEIDDAPPKEKPSKPPSAPPPPEPESQAAESGEPAAAEIPLVDMLHMEALRASLNDVAASQSATTDERSPAPEAEEEHRQQAEFVDSNAADSSKREEAAADEPTETKAEAPPEPPIEAPVVAEPVVEEPVAEQPVVLNSDLVKQARKQAASFLNKETRSATHLRLIPIGRDTGGAIQPEEAIVVPEPFDGSPSLDDFFVPAPQTDRPALQPCEQRPVERPEEQEAAPAWEAGTSPDATTAGDAPAAVVSPCAVPETSADAQWHYDEPAACAQEPRPEMDMNSAAADPSVQQSDRNPAPFDPSVQQPDGNPAPFDPSVQQPDGNPAPFDPSVQQSDGNPAPFDPSVQQPDGNPASFDPSVQQPDGNPAPFDPSPAQPDVNRGALQPSPSQPNMKPAAFIPSPLQPNMNPAAFIPSSPQPKLNPAAFDPSLAHPDARPAAQADVNAASADNLASLDPKPMGYEQSGSSWQTQPTAQGEPQQAAPARNPAIAPLPRPPVASKFAGRQAQGNATSDSAAATAQRQLLNELVAGTRKPVPPQPTERTAPAEQRVPPLTQPQADRRESAAGRMASRLEQTSNNDSVGIAVFCVLFFVVSCAGTIVFGPRVLVSLSTVLHSIH